MKVALLVNTVPYRLHVDIRSRDFNTISYFPIFSSCAGFEFGQKWRSVTWDRSTFTPYSRLLFEGVPENS